MEEPDLLTELEEARQRRDDGQRQAVHGSNPAWKAAAEIELERLAASGRPFTADDLAEAVGPPMAGASHQAVGGLFSQACRRGLIQATGFCQSRRASRHASVLRVWRGAS